MQYAGKGRFKAYSGRLSDIHWFAQSLFVYVLTSEVVNEGNFVEIIMNICNE